LDFLSLEPSFGVGGYESPQLSLRCIPESCLFDEAVEDPEVDCVVGTGEVHLDCPDALTTVDVAVHFSEGCQSCSLTADAPHKAELLFKVLAGPVLQLWQQQRL